MSNSIANVIPLIMTAELLNEDVKYLKKKKKTSKDSVKFAVRNVVGLSLIGATSKIINS
jgi:hypothetical protein